MRSIPRMIGVWGVLLALVLLAGSPTAPVAATNAVPGFGAGPTTHAPLHQDRSVVVERRDGNVTIEQDGDLRFVETWEVRFDGGPFRFAFRDIPLDRLTGISDWSVRANGQQYQNSDSTMQGTFLVAGDGGSERITWYFPPATNETRVFELSYTVEGALRIYEDGDQFFWKYIEADREYTINNARVVVNLPGSFAADEILTRTYINVEDAGFGEEVDSSTVLFTGGPFPPGTEWEVRVQFPHGVVDAEPQFWQRLADSGPLLDLVALGGSVLLFLGGIVGLYFT
ncbi:MAG: DUF2207 domain-containing protein, partial [Chloroflexaceae bacterium]|nr:DUF2207 domain-containing protein [Chloroflexaceae bacterium]